YDTAAALAAGLSGASAPPPSSSGGGGAAAAKLKAVEMLAIGLEQQVRDSAIGGSERTAFLGQIGILRDVAQGKSIRSAIEQQIMEGTNALKRMQQEHEDPDKMKPIRDRLARLREILSNAEGGGAEPAAPSSAPASSSGALARPGTADPYRVLAVWWLDSALK